MPLRLILCQLLAGLLAGAWGMMNHAPTLDSRLPTLAPPPARADSPGDWPMFGHDPAHTGYNPEETQLKPPLRLKWSYATGSGIESSPAVANGVAYVGSNDGKLYALDAATGSLRWSYTTGGAVGSSPAVASGVVYVGASDGRIYAFETLPIVSSVYLPLVIKSYGAGW